MMTDSEAPWNQLPAEVYEQLEIGVAEPALVKLLETPLRKADAFRSGLRLLGKERKNFQRISRQQIPNTSASPLGGLMAAGHEYDDRLESAPARFADIRGRDLNEPDVRNVMYGLFRDVAGLEPSDQKALISMIKKISDIKVRADMTLHAAEFAHRLGSKVDNTLPIENFLVRRAQEGYLQCTVNQPDERRKFCDAIVYSCISATKHGFVGLAGIAELNGSLMEDLQASFNRYYDRHQVSPHNRLTLSFDENSEIQFHAPADNPVKQQAKSPRELLTAAIHLRQELSR